MGATFYLAYFLQAVRGYTPLAAGVALIAVAAGVMIAGAAVGQAEPSGSAPRMVTGTGMTLFGVRHGLATRFVVRHDAAVGDRGADVRAWAPAWA